MMGYCKCHITPFKQARDIIVGLASRSIRPERLDEIDMRCNILQGIKATAC